MTNCKVAKQKHGKNEDIYATFQKNARPTPVSGQHRVVKAKGHMHISI